MARELTKLSTEELLRRASDPQEGVAFAEAIAELVQRYKSVVYSQALSVSAGNQSLADDVFQETFLGLFKWLKSRRGAPPLHSFARLVQVFSKRAAIDLIRKNRLHDSLPEPTFDPKWEDRLYVKELMDAMDERSREIMRLTYFEGRSAPEIAKLLKIKAGNVRILRFRALEAIREWEKRDRVADVAEEL
jgi:RNA polymerase sigma factor (sigma-70 family)